jgi:hypothetical protein
MFLNRFSVFHSRLAAASLLGLAAFMHSADASAASASYTDFSQFQAATSSMTTDTFEAAPWTPVGDKAQGLANLGVGWTAANIMATFNHDPGVVLTSTDPGAVGDIFDWIEAELPDNVTAVGGWITSFNMAHDTELQAFDAFDNLLGSVALDNTGGAYEFLGLVTDTAIARVRFVSTNVTNPIGDDFALDDFTFGTGNLADPTPVPTPSALALFGVALAGLGFARRRRT